jgi:hypothetical protein
VAWRLARAVRCRLSAVGPGPAEPRAESESRELDRPQADIIQQLLEEKMIRKTCPLPRSRRNQEIRGRTESGERSARFPSGRFCISEQLPVDCIATKACVPKAQSGLKKGGKTPPPPPKTQWPEPDRGEARAQTHVSLLVGVGRSDPNECPNEAAADAIRLSGGHCNVLQNAPEQNPTNIKLVG